MSCPRCESKLSARAPERCHNCGWQDEKASPASSAGAGGSEADFEAWAIPEAVTAVSAARGGAPVEPVWAAAARALAEGRLHVPSRAHTIRPESTYEMDPREA